MNPATDSYPEATVEVDGMKFPPFDLGRLMNTVFELNEGESFGVFTDLADPRDVQDFRYLEQDGLGPQRHAYRTLYQGLLGLKDRLRLKNVAFYAYKEVGGSNLDLPDTVWTPTGEELPLREVLKRHTIALYMGRYSATAPITALAKEMGFRGATMHGVNETILKSGLAVNYEEVSAEAEKLRSALTRIDQARFEWTLNGARMELTVELAGQEAQKSHGLVRTLGDVANLPAGEVYYVPVGAEGILPQKFEDSSETIALFDVTGGKISGVREFIRGDRKLVEDYMKVIEEDPSAGKITELGLGTQTLPFSGSDIQDEKIIGTAHLATGRSDHLGGNTGPKDFKHAQNASHNDILFSPNKTPEIVLDKVWIIKGGQETLILDDYKPTEFIRNLL